MNALNTTIIIVACCCLPTIISLPTMFRAGKKLHKIWKNVLK